MSSRLVTRATLAACLLLTLGTAHATVTYYGTGGVAANFFESNSQSACTGCHSGTPSAAYQNVVLDTYSRAFSFAQMALNAADWDDGVYDGQVPGNYRMPQGAASPVTDGELALLSTWIAGGKPDYAAPQVTTGSASSITQYAATLAGTGNGGGASTTYHFQYGLTTGYGSVSSGTTPSDTGGGQSQSASFSVGISGLNCGTTYNFRVRGSNSQASNVAGSNNSFGTAACPTVTTISDQSVNEDTAVSFTVSSTNKSGSTSVSYALDGTSTGRGMSINASTGAFSWPAASTPDAPTSTTGYTVTVTATYTTAGSADSVDTDTFSINVSAVNDAPTITSTAGTSASEGSAYSYDVNATDIEGSTLTYSLTTKPTGMLINSSTGVITWTPPDQAANYSENVTVSVTDGGLTDTESFTINVTANNDAPSFTSSAVTSANESSAYSYDVDATDPESQTLTYSLTTKPTGMTINASTGVISWTPAQALSDYSENVTVSVTDGTTAVTQSFTVAVGADNDAPTFTSVDVTSAAETVVYTYDVDATDPESQTLTYSLTTKPTGMTINASTGVISWTPPDQAANYSENVTVSVTDGTTAVPRSFTINVTSSNDPPSFSSAAVTDATEGVAYSYDANATDPEGGALTYSLTTKPTGMTIDAATGVISWTPPQALADYTEGVTVRVTDGSNPVTQSFTITISADNDAPSFTSSDVTSVNEDTAYSYDVNATDLEGQTLTFALTTKPTGMTINASTGVISWTPPLNSNAPADVTVTVSDATTTVSRSFTITVNPINDEPVIGTSAVTTLTEDTAYSYDVNASDVDGDTLTYSLSVKPTGMTINASTGVISWTPPQDSNTSVNVTVSVSDGSATDSQAFTISITPVNDAPVIDTAAVTTDSGSGSYSYNVDASDIDGDTLIYSLPTRPTGMTINSSTGAISWSVPASIDNPYAVTVLVSDRADGSALTVAQSFSITVADGDGDDVADYADNCVSTSNTDQTNTDVDVNAPGDALGDACDSDDDNDLIPDTVELANGLDPLDDSDAAGDINNDGDTNLEDFQSCSGLPCYAISNPVILTNGDQVVAATGYHTPVTLTATATGVNGPLTVTADQDGPFRPGSYTVTWSADWRSADGEPQVATTTQEVKVLPLVTMGGSKVIGVGQTAYIPVRLLGEAPSYPVVVTVDASGATAGVDYTLPSSTVQFDSPETVKYLQVDVIDHGAAADKDLVLTVTGVTGEAALAATSQLSYTLRMTALPAPPDATLQTSQSGDIRSVIYQDDGSFVVDALVSDPNGTGTATCEMWLANPFVTTAGGAACQLIVDPAGVTPGVYSITVTVGDGDFVVTRRIDISLVGGNAPTLSSDDTDGDSIANNVELAVDANGNGLLDYLDINDNSAPETIQLSLAASELLLMAVTDSGLRLVAGGYAVAAQSTSQAGIQIFETQVASGATPILDRDYAAIGAIFDFGVEELAGDTTVAHVVLPLPVVLATGAQWRELSATSQWQSFVTTATDTLMSAPRGADGQCPPPQDAAYTSGLTGGNACVQVTVSDGGPNDADGEVNGSVRVTGAPTVSRDEIAATIPTESQSGGSADFWTLMVLVLALLGFRRKEQLQ